MTVQATVAEQIRLYCPHGGRNGHLRLSVPDNLKDTDLVVMVAGSAKRSPPIIQSPEICRRDCGSLTRLLYPVWPWRSNATSRADRTTDYQQAGPFFAKTVNSDRTGWPSQVLIMGFDGR